MSTDDIRINAITDWLTHTLKLEIQQLEPASSDASFRRYFRVTHSNGQHIVMDAPPDKENTEPFVRLAQVFKVAGVNVPTIYEQDLEQGFLLLEDFGSVCLLDQLTNRTAPSLYTAAFEGIITLQHNVSITDGHLPHYDKTLLTNEMGLFYDWFLQKQLGLAIPVEVMQSLNPILIDSALEQPQVCVHRDYHSRNLMVLDNNDIGVIDFQDAVIGAITYDAVSLLRDCYISWSAEQLNQWLGDYFQKITDKGLITTDFNTFVRWFDLMGLQRHLKAIGIFSRLNLRDAKPNYLQDIPRTLGYVGEIARKYPELALFNQYLKSTILATYQP